MCIYCTTSNYRKIYINHHGPIPKDEQGRAFDIHHIDGNRSNNDPSNLKALSILDHYNIHYSQGDYAACFWMMSQRMEKTPEELSELARKAAHQRVENGTHHFNSENTKKWAQEQKERGTLYLSSPKHAEFMRLKEKKRVEQGVHPFQGSNNPARKRVADGTHHTLGPLHNKKMLEQGLHATQRHKTCPHCGTTMDSMNYAKHHGDNCSLVKEKIPLSANPNYVNSRAKRWLITDTNTGESYEVVGLKTWAMANSYNSNTVQWSVTKHNRYKHYLIKNIS